MYDNDLNISFKELLPFYDTLTDEELKNLLFHSRIVDYKKGETLHTRDSVFTDVVLVLNGHLRSFMGSVSGKEITLFNLLERDMCILSPYYVYQNLTSEIYLKADVDSKVIIIDSSFFKELTSLNHSVQSFFVSLILDKLSKVMWVLEQVVFLNLDSRLASFLINEYYVNDSNILNITHIEIANHLGSAREVISRLLKRFENDNLVKLSRGSIEILDVDKLKSLEV